jgi:hypothetical protein
MGGKTMSKPVPRLFFNTSDEDKEAVRELLKAGVHCEFSGPIAEERTPLLVYNSMRWYGLDGIKEFIKRQKVEFSGSNVE